MTQKRTNRRRFLSRTALGLLALGMKRRVGAAGQKPKGKIPSYNSEMEYRRLGRTNAYVSAVCLGGHSRSKQKERTEIISRCIDLGINYVDSCSRYEVIRDAEALRGRRNKMYMALSHCGHEVRHKEWRRAKKLLQALDELLREAKLEHTDLWRITCFEPGGRHAFNTSCEIVEALEKAKRQGKARFVGISSHDRRWLKFMIEYFNELDVVLFPFTTMSKKAPKDSLFPTLKAKDIGAFGIKPFAAGSLFTGKADEDFRRARLAIRYILHTDTVVPIPGMNRISEVDNVFKAIQERRRYDLKENASIGRVGGRLVAELPPSYRWLKDWEYV